MFLSVTIIPNDVEKAEKLFDDLLNKIYSVNNNVKTNFNLFGEVFGRRAESNLKTSSYKSLINNLPESCIDIIKYNGDNWTNYVGRNNSACALTTTILESQVVELKNLFKDDSFLLDVILLKTKKIYDKKF